MGQVRAWSSTLNDVITIFAIPSQIGSGIAYHKITWDLIGSVSAATIKLQGSNDNSSWTDIITGTATSDGASSQTAGTYTYYRLNLSTFTAPVQGTYLVVTYFGYTTLDSTTSFTSDVLISDASATAFVVGPNGLTDPTFKLVTNVSNAVTGLSITGNVAGSGVTLTALSSGSNEGIKIVPKGTSAALEVAPTAGDAIFKLTPNGANSSQLTGVTGALYIQTSSASDLIFRTNSTENMRIKSGGLVAIGAGTGTPTYVLYIAPTSGVTAAQTVFIQDATVSTGSTKLVIKAGAVNGNLLELQDSSGNIKSFMDNAGVIRGTGNIKSDAGFLDQGGKYALSTNTVGLSLGSLQFVKWAATDAYNGTIDVALYRNAANVLEVNTGTAGVFATIKAIHQVSANATTGLTAGVLAALTNASIVITDGSGQVYRIPCII